MKRTITVDGLRAGLFPAISGAELAMLSGCSLSKLEKARTNGTGIPFVKDPVSGRIGYTATDVLAWLERGQRCTSTAQYNTASQLERLERARAVLAAKRSVRTTHPQS